MMEQELIPDVKKKRVNSKAKGSGFERTISGIFAKAFAPLAFKRTDGSGARLGGKNWEKMFASFSKEMMAQYIGDICSTNEADCPFYFNFVVECKSYGDREPSELLFGKSLIYSWILEVEADCVKLNKPGIVICKWKNTPIYACYRGELPTDKKLHILEGIQVCHLDDILDKRDFWLTVK